MKLISHMHYIYCADEIMPSCHGKGKDNMRLCGPVHSNPVNAGENEKIVRKMHQVSWRYLCTDCVCVTGCVCQVFMAYFMANWSVKLIAIAREKNVRKKKDVYSMFTYISPPFQAHRVLLFIPFACLSYSVEQENSCRQHCLKW